ncbi:amino acid ABC transporter ATP-binding/permease protein [Nitratireductor kimnyeongensis]|uniref:Amino acid ABC transporter ATP-binding/permease protein n=1 Tax=Nitratireductor kimnyeongensis TaxID=430679 RepID=A0ABW0T883_9HYPH|nr:amino acid ABC transporter ATP-binding/permease protein [Nitratireductor kimnyeongensis]QZZ34076.1 amino acid ABC transporter ATP-binding/permease protein [Nitratireductor kimnyeongensis]
MTGKRDLLAVARLFWLGSRSKLLSGALLALATVLCGITLLGLSGWFIAATAIAGLSLTTALAFDVFAPSAGIRFLALARTASRYGERIATHDATLEVLAELRERLFRGWAVAGAARAMAARPARLLFRLTNDIDALDSLYLRVLVPLFSAAGAAIMAGLALGFIDWRLGVATAVFLVAVGLGVPALAARRAHKPARRRAHALEVLRARSVDLVRGQGELIMTGRIMAQREAIAQADERLAQADDSINRVETRVNATLGVAGAGLLAAVLFAGAQLAEAGRIGAPVAALALLVALTATEPFAALRRGAVELGRTLVAVGRVGPRLQQDVGAPANKAPDAPLTAVSMAHVTASYPGGSVPTLANVSLRLKSGERVAVIGASGAGKSSLLAVIAGEMTIDRGAVASLPSILFTQRTELFHDTLRGNLSLADPSAVENAMLAALQAAGLAPMVQNLPHGLDTMLGEGGSGLSTGQARRLALARLILQNTPVWLLDEPTEGLDPDTANDVIARVRQVADDKTLVIATHIRREADIADRILRMEHGRIVADARRGTEAYTIMLESLRPE